MINKYACRSSFVIVLISLSSCFISAGTHGSIKGYQYETSKGNLQKAVMAVIKSNPNIFRDTSLDHLGSSPLLDSANSRGDYSAGDNYYNDIKHYVTIKITPSEGPYEYTFRYYGDDEDWKTSANSELFICYAYDQNHKGGHEGDKELTDERLKKLTAVFENEFVSKISKELTLQYTVEEK
jgi:hypothetical protein